MQQPVSRRQVDLATPDHAGSAGNLAAVAADHANLARRTRRDRLRR
jgi:hypothetical protein